MCLLFLSLSLISHQHSAFPTAYCFRIAFLNIFFINLTVAPTDVASAVGYVNLRLTNQTNSSLQTAGYVLFLWWVWK